MSDDSNVATVDQTGLVTAVGTGNCRITAYDKLDGYLKSNLDITVEAEDTNSDVLFIWGESDATMVEVGDTLRLFVSKNGESYSDVTYAIDNTELADISEDGVLTGKVEGTVVVTVTDKADASVTTSKSFEVVAEIAVEAIFVHGAGDVNTITEPGGQLQIVAQASPSGELYTDVTFSVNDETIATIDSTSGWLTAVGNGTVVVTGTSTVDVSLTDTCEIVISNQGDESGDINEDVGQPQQDRLYVIKDGYEATQFANNEAVSINVVVESKYVDAYNLSGMSVTTLQDNTEVATYGLSAIAGGETAEGVAVTTFESSPVTLTTDITSIRADITDSDGVAVCTKVYTIEELGWTITDELSVEPYFVQLLVNEEVQLAVTKNGQPYDNVNYSISGLAGGTDTNILEISDTGLIKATKLGGVYVKVTDKDDASLYKEITVWVVEEKSA